MITIDDEFHFAKDMIQFGNITDLTFSEPSLENPSLWGMLLEKAWSKLQVNYENSAGGFTN